MSLQRTVILPLEEACWPESGYVIFAQKEDG